VEQHQKLKQVRSGCSRVASALVVRLLPRARQLSGLTYLYLYLSIYIHIYIPVEQREKLEQVRGGGPRVANLSRSRCRSIYLYLFLSLYLSLSICTCGAAREAQAGAWRLPPGYRRPHRRPPPTRSPASPPHSSVLARPLPTPSAARAVPRRPTAASRLGDRPWRLAPRGLAHAPAPLERGARLQ